MVKLLITQLKKELKETNRSFLKNQVTKNATNKTKYFWKLSKSFFPEKDFYYKQKFTLKTIYS